MQFEEKISLSEMLALLAWGEPVTANELGSSGPPCERAYQSEWDAQLEKCRREVGADPELSDLAQLLDDSIGIPLMPTADALEAICRAKAWTTMIAAGQLNDDHGEPSAEQLEEDRRSWPACRRLYSLACDRRARISSVRARWKERSGDWSKAANKAFGPVEGTASYNGWWRNKKGCDKEPSKIGREALDRLIPQWATDRIELVTGRGLGTAEPDEPVAFTNVECSRKSFEHWLAQSVNAEPTTAEPAILQVGTDQGQIGPPNAAACAEADEAIQQIVRDPVLPTLSTVAARRRAIKFLSEIMRLPKPAGTTKPSVRADCMAKTQVNDYGFRIAWSIVSTTAHSSWTKAGRPKSNI